MFKLCVITRWDLNICVRSSPLRGIAGGTALNVGHVQTKVHDKRLGLAKSYTVQCFLHLFFLGCCWYFLPISSYQINMTKVPALSHFGLRTCNSLPTLNTCSKTLSSFKINLKTYFLQKYLVYLVLQEGVGRGIGESGEVTWLCISTALH